MQSDFQARLQALIDASDGAIWIESGDRDTETQQRLWDEAVATYGPDEARNWVAPPGHSNHERGIAVDLGGDLDLARQLAPQFGLYQPMSWEPWHYEPVGSRDEDMSPQAYSNRPVNSSSLYRSTQVRDYSNVLRDVLNIRPLKSPDRSEELILQQGGTEPFIAGNPAFLSPELMDILGPLKLGGKVPVQGTGISPFASSSAGNRPLSGSRGSTDIDKFMYALRDVESSHNYSAEGVPTPWGTATGAYQYLDGTWDNYMGYRRAMDAPPEIQDQKAREDMQRYYDEYQSWDDVAAAWYSGPGGNWQSGEVREYVGKVNSRL